MKLCGSSDKQRNHFFRKSLLLLLTLNTKGSALKSSVVSEMANIYGSERVKDAQWLKHAHTHSDSGRQLLRTSCCLYQWLKHYKMWPIVQRLVYYLTKYFLVKIISLVKESVISLKWIQGWFENHFWHSSVLLKWNCTVDNSFNNNGVS